MTRPIYFCTLPLFKTRLKTASHIMLALLFLLAVSSCEKDDMEPDNTDPMDQNDDDNNDDDDDQNNDNVDEADVNGLAQNYVTAVGVNEVLLTITSIERWEAGDDSYIQFRFSGEGNTMVTVQLKGEEPQVGNYSLKKFVLASNPDDGEAIVSVAINGTLLDFEISENDQFSIAKNAEGFFVFKMSGNAGIERNSWDPELNEPISFHIVSNPAKIKISDSVNGEGESVIYSYKLGDHKESGQPYATVSLSDNAPSKSVDINFLDYDLDVASMTKADYTLSTTPVSPQESLFGTAPKGVHMSCDFGAFTQDHSATQTIEMELQEKYIIVKYTDIKMVNKSDETETLTISGEIMMAR